MGLQKLDWMGIGIRTALACVSAGLILYCDVGIAQLYDVRDESVSADSTQRLGPATWMDQGPPSGLETQDSLMPKQVVKVIFDPATNRLTLVGTPEDIAVVKRAILDLQSKMSESPEVAMERVSLTFQLSDTVAGILTESMRLDGNGDPRLKISPLHFPEAILLVGPSLTVKRAKAIIKEIDSHDYFSTDGKPKPLRPTKPKILN